MTAEQIQRFLDVRHQWWKYAGEVSEDARRHVWEPDLYAVDKETAWEAMKRFARKARDNRAPSLDDLLALCRDIADERHRAEAKERRATDDRLAMEAWQKAYVASGQDFRQRQAADVIGQVLTHAATDAYARAHVTMNDLGVNRPGREAEAVAFCEAKALEQPEEQERWIREARLYERERLKALVTPVNGQRYVPDMTGRTVIEEMGEDREPGDEDPDEGD
jgi:hypothetical protein